MRLSTATKGSTPPFSSTQASTRRRASYGTPAVFVQSGAAADLAFASSRSSPAADPGELAICSPAWHS